MLYARAGLIRALGSFISGECKMLNRKAITTTVALLIMFSSPSHAVPQTSKVLGTVIARTPFEHLSFISLGEYPIFQQLIVRVEHDGQSLRKEQYLRLFFNNNPSRTIQLPKAMFKTRGLWEFTLTRLDESCDIPLRDLIKHLGPEDSSSYWMVPWAKKEELPLDGKAQCYEFKADGFKKH
jgi:hypothetical protein